MAAKKITVKLLIDKEKNRVVLAESESDFVDVLFSFLTLPMGTIIRLLGKESNLGSFNKLYESMEDLDTKYLQTEACKTMLLRPISSVKDLCKNLWIKIDDTKPMTGFCCRNWTKGCPWWSTVKNTKCKCGKMIDLELTSKKTELEGNGAFVKQSVMFMISDDLRIIPVSTEAGNFMLNILRVSKGTIFEEQIVEIGRNEKSDLNHVVNSEFIDKTESLNKQEEEMEPVRITAKLFLSMSDKKVLYGEVGDEFVDLLFSLLVLPLGSIMKYLVGNSSMGSLDNLYKSVEDLKVGECMISEDRKAMLLSPKLAPFSGCDNQLMQTTEKLPDVHTLIWCTNCSLSSWDNIPSCCASKKIEEVVLFPTNPKNREPSIKTGGRYVMGPVKYMVTDELVIKPLSFISIMDKVHQLKKPMFDVKEKAVCIGKAEVIALIRATLTTKSALTSDFSPKGKKKFLRSLT